MSHLIGNAEFKTITGKIQHETAIIVSNYGISQFSLIIEKYDTNHNPIPFNHELFHVYVSNDAYDNPPEDEDSYFNVMLAPDKWIYLRSVDCGTESQVNNSFGEKQSGTQACPTHFKYTKILMDEIPNAYVKLITSSR